MRPNGRPHRLACWPFWPPALLAAPSLPPPPPPVPLWSPSPPPPPPVRRGGGGGGPTPPRRASAHASDRQCVPRALRLPPTGTAGQKVFHLSILQLLSAFFNNMFMMRSVYTVGNIEIGLQKVLNKRVFNGASASLKIQLKPDWSGGTG